MKESHKEWVRRQIYDYDKKLQILIEDRRPKGVMIDVSAIKNKKNERR